MTFTLYTHDDEMTNWDQSSARFSSFNTTGHGGKKNKVKPCFNSHCCAKEGEMFYFQKHNVYFWLLFRSTKAQGAVVVWVVTAKNLRQGDVYRISLLLAVKI